MALRLFLYGYLCHVGLSGNSTADTVAKTALIMPVTNLTTSLITAVIRIILGLIIISH